MRKSTFHNGLIGLFGLAVFCFAVGLYAMIPIFAVDFMEWWGRLLYSDRIFWMFGFPCILFFILAFVWLWIFVPEGMKL